MSNDIDPVLFREALGHYPTGVAVVTATLDDGSPSGMVVGTFSSVSLDPPLIAFFPMSNSKSFVQLRTASNFCINVLASDQEPLCRKLATGGDTKFDGVAWHAGPLGSPVLEDAVAWIECTFDDIREAGDHFIVLGLVHEFAVQRSTLPLLFFQGGYGRFSLGSFVAAPSPDLIQAAQLAEAIRGQVEALSSEFDINCSVVARIGWDSVQVLAVNDGDLTEIAPLGHRQPLIPPFGAVLMVNSPQAEIDDWLGRSPDHSAERRDLNVALLEKVRERGYSLLAAGPEVVLHHEKVLSAFEESGGMPGHDRVVRQVTSELAELFSPDIVPGSTYDLASIVVLIPTKEGQPTMALRMTQIPGSIPAERVDALIAGMKQVAQTAAEVAGARS